MENGWRRNIAPEFTLAKQIELTLELRTCNAFSRTARPKV